MNPRRCINMARDVRRESKGVQGWGQVKMEGAEGGRRGGRDWAGESTEGVCWIGVEGGAVEGRSQSTEGMICASGSAENRRQGRGGGAGR